VNSHSLIGFSPLGFPNCVDLLPRKAPTNSVIFVPRVLANLLTDFEHHSPLVDQAVERLKPRSHITELPAHASRKPTRTPARAVVNQSVTTTQNDHENDESAVIDLKSPDINSTNQHDINSAVHM
jgi:hypothetical protein